MSSNPSCDEDTRGCQWNLDLINSGCQCAHVIEEVVCPKNQQCAFHPDAPHKRPGSFTCVARSNRKRRSRRNLIDLERGNGRRGRGVYLTFAVVIGKSSSKCATISFPYRQKNVPFRPNPMGCRSEAPFCNRAITGSAASAVR